MNELLMAEWYANRSVLMVFILPSPIILAAACSYILCEPCALFPTRVHTAPRHFEWERFYIVCASFVESDERFCYADFAHEFDCFGRDSRAKANRADQVCERNVQFFFYVVVERVQN